MNQQPSMTITLQGTIDTCFTTKSTDIYCKYGFYYGSDWVTKSGSKAGVSHNTQSNSNNESIFNFPIGITFNSTTPFGWPQFIISVYGLNSFGNDMIVGYGGIHLPSTPGKFNLKIPLFSPKPESFIQKINAYFTGLYPELIDSNLIAQSTNRDVLKTTSQGYVNVTFQMVINNLENFDMKS